MTTNHILYIPLVLLLGLIIGIIIGRRSVEAAEEEERRLADRREHRRKRLMEAADRQRAAEPDGSGEGAESEASTP